MNVLGIITILCFLCAFFNYINARFLKFQPSIGLMIMALISALLLKLFGSFNPIFYNKFSDVIKHIDFSKTLLNIMLGFLLFAGSLHVSVSELKKQKAAVISFSLLGTALSVFFFGGLIYLVFKFLNQPIDLVYCLLFGAVVSPTDPIAVLGILGKTKIPKEIEIVISGESLFNDGIGVVFFVTIMDVINNGVESLTVTGVLMLFGQEVIGGLALGLAIGYLVYLIVQKIDNYHTEIFISIAVVMLCSEAAHLLHVSGLLAIVVVGLMVGNKVKHTAMSDVSKDYHFKFWEIIDEFLNSILFVLIGLQIIVMPFVMQHLLIGVISIVVLLFCRWLSLIIPIQFLKDKKLYNFNTANIITWGGLRGGLSVALALSLPDYSFKEVFVSITYIIVIFSIIVQGLTTEALVKKFYK